MSTLISKHGEINPGIVGGSCGQDLANKKKSVRKSMYRYKNKLSFEFFAVSYCLS